MVLILRGTEHDPDHLPLATKKGWRIPNAVSEECPDEKIPIAIEYGRKQARNAILRSFSQTYNCVGMIFGARRTCIDDIHIQKILDDDGYRRRTIESDIVIGDVIVYRKSDGQIRHIGMVAKKDENVLTGEFSFTILSKWGADLGEYFHAPDDVPATYLLDTTIEYWSERKIP